MSSPSVVWVPNAWNSDGARNDVPTEARTEKSSVGRHSSVALGSVGSTPVAVALVAAGQLQVQAPP